MKVAVIMGSISDWSTMSLACDILEEFGVTYDKHIVSAHRTPEKMMSFSTEARKNGIGVIIAGAGGAAHLPGMVASSTTLPVIGVPIQTQALNGLDSLLSIVQMPGGIPVATTAIGKAGAKNAGLLAVQMLSMTNATLERKLDNYRLKMKEEVFESEAQLD